MKIEEMKIVAMILSRCEEQSEYYKRIADKGDYKDETVNRFVNLGIAYDDVSMYIKLLLNSEQLQNAFVGDPAKVGQQKETATETLTKTTNIEP